MRNTDFKSGIKGTGSNQYLIGTEVKYQNRYLRGKKLYRGTPKGKTWIGTKTRVECRGEVKSRWEERTVEVKGGEDE